MDKIFLVDGSSVFFRSFHAIRDLRRSDGMMTNAIYGYFLTIRSLLNDYQPKEMLVAFDRPERTFRKELYEAYKANRVEPPEELVAQIPFIKQGTDLLGIPQFEEPGFEADDIIGTLAYYLSQQGKEVVMVSSDKDLLQLVNHSIVALRLTPKGNVFFKAADVEERFGVKPEQFIDFLALMGDSSDNIPGVPGIGEKTARDLIQQFGSLEALYDQLDLVKGKKRKENLAAKKEQAFLSKKLVTIKLDMPIDFDSLPLEIKSPNKDDLYAFYSDMEFRSFAEVLGSHKEDGRPCDYQSIKTIDDLKTMLKAIEKKGGCAVDTETTSLDQISAKLVGLSFSIDERQGWYVPLGHREAGNLDRDEAFPLLNKVLSSETIKKVGHHIKYDRHILQNEGYCLKGIEDDTLIASYLVQPERQTHKLDDLAFSQLNMKLTPISDLIGSGKAQKCMADIAIETVSSYACEDTDATWRLKNKLIPLIDKYQLTRLYREVEIPLIDVLVDMERRGVKVDPEILMEQSQALGEEMNQLADEIYTSVGREFNLNSPLQLAKILYDDLQLLSGRKRSTRADILEKLANDGVVIAKQILDYRHRQKIKSTYLDALQSLIRPQTGRVHTTYNQTVATTGRLSSSDPNLQNIPIRTELGRRVRQAFIAEKGFLLLSLDYSQIELRVLAHISNDPGLLAAFKANEDIHRRTAAEIFNAAMDEVTPDMRRKAKEINFGLNYGMSPYGLARRLAISDKEASRYIETYFTRYPLVQAYMDETVALAQEHLFVKTLLGRRIPTVGIRDQNRTRQENARRAAINAPIQGSSADLLKTAMVNIHRKLDREKASVLLTVHDELILEVKEDHVDEVTTQCKSLMENALELSVPTPVEVAVGSSWADLK